MKKSAARAIRSGDLSQQNQLQRNSLALTAKGLTISRKTVPSAPYNFRVGLRIQLTPKH
ncbi:MAG: hypothetical protein LBP22_01780 [Deltaproteobacteria bacterium]|jgi:hypothetical protein|nr:hypothetical protein [Deltaproteobacteria bacterium]